MFWALPLKYKARCPTGLCTMANVAEKLTDFTAGMGCS